MQLAPNPFSFLRWHFVDFRAFALVFTTMGAGSSSYPGDGTYGYHVVSVTEGSPGHKAGLEAFFDYLVAIDGHRLNKVDSTLQDVLGRNENRAVNLTVYNSKKDSCRDVSFTPTRTWGGQGLLGINIRFTSFEGANENVWHIMDVVPGSPAACAGLQSDVDYVIGSDQHMTAGDDICSLVENHDGKALKLYVYSTVTDACREVTVTPNSNWGGEGLLGCDIGYGYLHRIPRTAGSIASAAASEAFTVTTGTMPHHQPVAGEPAVPGADGFSEVPLGTVGTQYPSGVPGQQPLSQVPVAQPVTTHQQFPPAEVHSMAPMQPGTGAPAGMPVATLGGIDSSLAGLSLTTSPANPLTTAAPFPMGIQSTGLSTAAPLVPTFPPVSTTPTMPATSPLPSNAPAPVFSPATSGLQPQDDVKQSSPLAAVATPPTAAAIPSYATPASVTVVRGQTATGSASPVPAAASSATMLAQQPLVQPTTGALPSASGVLSAPSISIPPLPALNIPGLAPISLSPNPVPAASTMDTPPS